MNKYEQALHDEATKRGYTVLGRYVSSKTKIEMYCKNGHVFKIIPNAFNRGIGCAKCSGKCSEESKNKFIEIVIDRKYKLLSEYKKSHSKCKIQCPNGHVVNITPSDFKSGKGCPKCSRKCPDQAKRNFYNLLDELGYKRVSEYKRALSKVQLVCDKQHHFKMTPADIKMGHRCPSCSHNGFNKSKQGFLYILRSEEGLVKVGITNDITTRINKLSQTTPFHFDVLSVYSGCGHGVRACEKAFHRNHRRAGLRGFGGATEWLHMSDFGLVDFLTSIYDLTLTTYNR